MRTHAAKRRILAFASRPFSVRRFRRLALGMRPHGGDARKPSLSSLKALRKAAVGDAQEVLALLGSRRNGLSEDEAAARRAEIGLNEVQYERPRPAWLRLAQSYKNPFNLLLTVLAAVSFATHDLKATIVIGTMVVVSTLLRFVQEERSNRAADKLKDMVSVTATVLRPDEHGNERRAEVPIKHLVPGDVVLLSAGDMIPADARVLAAKDLFVTQATLTGEALPVEKFARLKRDDPATPFDLDNVCFMGTNVVSGSAVAAVVTTGGRTYFGSLAERVVSARDSETAFQAGINKVSWLLIRFMFVMAPLVLLINGFTKGDWVEALLFALAVAVGLTPEMLPMIVTATLAKGAVTLSRKKVIVKRLDAIHNIGAMEILCTDKTGTLTQNKIFLEKHIDPFGEPSDVVLAYAYLNSYYQTGLKNLLDVAVLEHAHNYGAAGPHAHHKVDEVPFDFQRRRMSVIVGIEGGRHLMVCKGAVDEMLAVCGEVQQGDARRPLTAETLADIREVTAGLNSDGLRVVAVAVKTLAPEKDVYGVADEKDLALVGYIAFLDPPKESAAPAIAALRAHGVAVKILTGDNELVAGKVCREVGLAVEKVLTGADVDRLNDAELSLASMETTVFARLTPAHKERIVRALHAKGRVVGFLGDGINDAPALRSSDVGISVEGAADIAREAADLILLEKNLLVLEEGVREGRRTFGNMLKYVKMTASSNFGNVFSVLIASWFLPFLPMLPLQLLVQNLLYDISQIAIPFDKVDEEFLVRPRRWNSRALGRFMLFFGPVSSLFDVATFVLMWSVFGANSPERQSLFQSGWFVEGLLSQTLIVHMIRTRKIPFIESRAAAPLLVMTALIMAIGIFLPLSPFADYLRMQHLPLTYFPWLLVILFSYMAATQSVKHFYVRRYGWQ